MPVMQGEFAANARKLQVAHGGGVLQRDPASEASPSSLVASRPRITECLLCSRQRQQNPQIPQVIPGGPGYNRIIQRRKKCKRVAAPKRIRRR